MSSDSLSDEDVELADDFGLGELEEDSSFWYELDVDYEDVLEGADEDHRKILHLLYEFTNRKSRVIEDEYRTITTFVQHVLDLGEAEAKLELKKIYAKYQWSLKQTESEYQTEEGLDEIIENLQESEQIVV